MITTIHQGFFTTIQDEGRWGYQAYGMPVAGAMDKYSYRVANLLVGNQPGTGVIEMTREGAAFRFDEEQFVAVCGADMQGTLNDVPITNWSAFVAPKGCELKFAAAPNGYRTYLAVYGGFDVPLVLGSRSTYTGASVGGCEGRALRQGDVVYVGQEGAIPTQPQVLAEKFIPYYREEINLRVILGPQENMFSQEALHAFFCNPYCITEKADRIGYRLKGPKIMHIEKATVVSDALCLGAIQIPAHGMPVIMMADHQTTDGFAKLGSVIRVDLNKLAQAKPGDHLSFTCVREEMAIQALQEEKKQYSEIEALCKANGNS